VTTLCDVPVSAHVLGSVICVFMQFFYCDIYYSGVSVIFYFYFFIVGLRVEQLRASRSGRQVLYHLSQASSSASQLLISQSV
jgi:hypothetical protein